MRYRSGTRFAVEIDCGVTDGSRRAVCAFRATTIRQHIRNVGGDGVSYSRKYFVGGAEIEKTGRVRPCVTLIE
jgi:hypothetical protein